MPKTNQDEIVDIAQMITDYLLSHPKAADTEKGITWWLTRQCYVQIASKVPQALNYLVENRLVTTQRLADGAICYRAREREAGESD